MKPPGKVLVLEDSPTMCSLYRMVLGRFSGTLCVDELHLGRFTLFTGLGAGIWCTVLVVVGMGAGELLEQDRVYEYVKDEAGRLLLVYVLPALAFVVAVYWLWNRFVRMPVGAREETDA